MRETKKNEKGGEFGPPCIQYFREAIDVRVRWVVEFLTRVYKLSSIL
jgi:hypothetical protein